MRIDEASVVLTGAAGGIGAETARLLIEQGARVLLVGRTERTVLALANALSAASVDRRRVDALVVDLCTPAGRQAVVDAATARQANVLINNAAVPAFGPLAAMTAETVEAAVVTNLLAPIQLTRMMLPVLGQRHSLIVNVGSTAGAIGIPGFAAYGASKAGLQMFSEALRRELAGGPIKVLHVAPRAVDTGFNDAQTMRFNAETDTRCDPPARVAQCLLQSIRSERAERYIGWPEKAALRINRLLPGWLDGAFAKHRRALTPAADPTPHSI